MGDRVSIQFVHEGEYSPVLFSHWGGKELVKDIKRYLQGINTGGAFTPLDRLEPGTVMVDLIRYLTKDLVVVDSDYYLAINVEGGDNSDNGHYLFNLEDGKIEHTKGEYEE